MKEADHISKEVINHFCGVYFLLESTPIAPPLTIKKLNNIDKVLIKKIKTDNKIRQILKILNP